MNNAPNRIDPTPLRMSTNASVDRQTPKADFGDRLKAGVTNTAQAVAGGAALVAPMIPGAGIVSAAVSSVGGMTNANGSTGAAVSGQYMGGLSASTGGINTTLGGGMGGMGVVAVGGASGGSNTTTGGVDVSTGGAGVNGQSISQANLGGFGQDSVSQMAAESGQLLKLQFQMQQETQYFQTISNVLKTRHDTAKNSIGNIH